MGASLSNPLAADAAAQQPPAHHIQMPATASQVHRFGPIVSSSLQRLHLCGAHSLCSHCTRRLSILLCMPGL